MLKIEKMSNRLKKQNVDSPSFHKSKKQITHLWSSSVSSVHTLCCQAGDTSQNDFLWHSAVRLVSELLIISDSGNSSLLK